MHDLHGKHLILGITGGVAAYKVAELCRLMQAQGASVQVVMTDAACRFITPMTMQALSGRAVYTSQWDERQGNAMPHINLSREADAIIVAPASADFIAQLATGQAGELLALLCLARPLAHCPLMLAPAMNREMWLHPSTQRNLEQVRRDGAVILGPASGEQACGEVGSGRMLEAQQLLEAVVAHFQPKVLARQRVLITAGPTFEPIDPVRGITNHSSGKMGFAVARAAAEAGADVTLVAGPVALATPADVKRVDVQTAQQMFDAVMTLVPQVDVFVATAAVSDWRPAIAAEHKIKKTEGGKPPEIPLVQTPDILAAVAALPDAPYCVGFAAESENLLHHAQEKRQRKKIPLIVGNLGPATFGRDDNMLILVDEVGVKELAHADKLTLARELVAEIAQRLPRG